MILSGHLAMSKLICKSLISNYWYGNWVTYMDMCTYLQQNLVCKRYAFSAKGMSNILHKNVPLPKWEKIGGLHSNTDKNTKIGWQWIYFQMFF